MGQFSAPNYELHDEQNDWSPNDEIDPDVEPDDWTPFNYTPELYTDVPKEESPF